MTRNLTQQPLRIGILGCGSFILRRILPFLADIDTIQIVCLHNRSKNKAQDVCARYGIPHAVDSREELLAHPAVEAIFIATPNFLHEEDALACAKAGKPTLCEKPLSLSAESAQRMLAAFQEHSLPFFVGHQLRFKSALQKARQLHQEGIFGNLLHVRAYYFSRTSADDNWRFKKGNGGGVLQEVGIHLVDLIRFITGEEICSVQALGIFKKHAEAEQIAAVQCQLTSGTLASFECSFDRPYYNGFEMIGSKARLVSCNSLRQNRDAIETFCLIGDDDSQLFLPIQATNVYVDELKHFAEAVIKGNSSLISAEIGVANQKVIDAAYRSLNGEGKIYC